MVPTSDRDDRLRKLEPKLGENATRTLWLASQNPRLRRHIDPVISLLSDRLLQNSYREKQILLPPPEANVSAGPIKAGTVWYDSPRGNLGLHPNELVKHTGVVGASGSGKTTFGLRLTKSLLENDIPVVVFDVKRTWRSLVEYLPQDQVRVYTLARPEVSPFYHNFRHCQRKVARTEFSTDDRELGRPELTPLGKRGGAIELEIVS